MEQLNNIVFTVFFLIELYMLMKYSHTMARHYKFYIDTKIDEEGIKTYISSINEIQEILNMLAIGRYMKYKLIVYSLMAIAIILSWFFVLDTTGYIFIFTCNLILVTDIIFSFIFKRNLKRPLTVIRVYLSINMALALTSIILTKFITT